jgi:hypothetical protein
MADTRRQNLGKADICPREAGATLLSHTPEVGYGRISDQAAFRQTQLRFMLLYSEPCSEREPFRVGLHQIYIFIFGKLSTLLEHAK